jgi:hypothetical protein
MTGRTPPAVRERLRCMGAGASKGGRVGCDAQSRNQGVCREEVLRRRDATAAKPSARRPIALGSATLGESGGCDGNGGNGTWGPPGPDITIPESNGTCGAQPDRGPDPA